VVEIGEGCGRDLCRLESERECNSKGYFWKIKSKGECHSKNGNTNNNSLKLRYKGTSKKCYCKVEGLSPRED